MDPNSWAFLGLVVTNMCGLIGLYVQTRRGTQSLHSKVEPVSNGFARDVRQSLERIERRLDAHMRGHR